MPLIQDQLRKLDHVVAPEVRGRVRELRGLSLRVSAMPAPVGSLLELQPRKGRGGTVPAQIVGFDHGEAVAMPFGETHGIAPGDPVVLHEHAQTVNVGESLLGRVIDAMGRPLDGLGPLRDTTSRPLDPPKIDPLDRPLIDTPLGTGVRVVDAMISLGQGQRIGVFAPPGVGKSTLLGTMARHTQADVSVVAMIGERGREVRDFIDNVLGPEGLARSVVVVSTGDEPPLRRLRAAKLACSIAEFFRDESLDVLLLMDSVTRFAHAQRQIGLAAGEPPATKGFPPSVFSELPRLLERAGRNERGSVTGLYTVLMEGEDLDEPVVDACRGVLDGHILLDRQLAERGHYPAVSVLRSVSRVADEVTMVEHQDARSEVVRLLAAYRDIEELLLVGAYAPGTNAEADLAIAVKPAVDALFQQGRREQPGNFQTTTAQLLALRQHIEQARNQLARGIQRPVMPPASNSTAMQ